MIAASVFYPAPYSQTGMKSRLSVCMILREKAKINIFFNLTFFFSEDKESDGKEKKSKSKEKDKKKEPASMFQISGEKDSKSKKKGDHKSKVVSL